MKPALLSILIATSLFATSPKRPKLVVTIVIDQFRYDYLTRYRSEYHSGLDRLLTKGAVFTNARYEHYPTVTAVGHSTILSGATPSISGIIGNEWYDREEGRRVTSVSDSKTQLLGGAGGSGSSPNRLLVDTVGDELKMADGGKSRVVGISLKDRAAILPAGHMADGAYWFDAKTGNFVSSTYYFAELPQWVKAFNASRPAEKFAGAMWMTHKMPDDPKKLYVAVDASPFGNEMIEALAERALDSEQLGKRDGITDLLSVSFSSNDYVGHDFGPDSPEAHDMAVRSDALLERLFQAVDRTVGLDNSVVVLTADHGAAPSPETAVARKMPGGRIPANAMVKAAQAALAKKYGDGEWITADLEHSLYLNLPLIAQKNLEVAEVSRTVAQALAVLPHVFRVYTRDQLMNGALAVDQVGRRVINGFCARRAPDVEVLLEPYWIFGNSVTTHSTTFSYDAHVPVIFMGPGIRAGRYDGAVAVNDIAPTLATMLDVETPSGSVGRVLTEMLQ